MKKTILGGVLFLVPFAVLVMVLGKAYQVSLLIAQPINQIMPISGFAGVAFVDVVAVFLIVLACYIAGHLAKRGMRGRHLESIEGFLIDLMPGYAVVKGIIGSAADDEQMARLLKPVVVAFDDYDQIAFEIESSDKVSVLFLPGAPSAWSGSTVIVDKGRVRHLSVQTHQAVKLMRVMGRGSLSLITATEECTSISR